MITPQDIAVEIEREGQTITLRRVATNAAPVVVTCKAMVRGYRTEELVQGVVQGDRRIVVAATTLLALGWPVPPRKGDQVEASGKRLAVQGVDEILVRDAPAKFVIQARG